MLVVCGSHRATCADATDVVAGTVAIAAATPSASGRHARTPPIPRLMRDTTPSLTCLGTPTPTGIHYVRVPYRCTRSPDNICSGSPRPPRRVGLHHPNRLPTAGSVVEGVGEHSRGGHPVAHAEAQEDRPHVELDRVHADEQSRGDVHVGEAVGEQPQHLELPLRQ